MNCRLRQVRRMLVLLVLLVLMIPGAAAAQTPAAPPSSASAPGSPSADDEALPRRDVFGFIGWRGSSYDSNYFSGNQWDARFVYGGTFGYYFTPNLKLEADLSGTTTSRFTEYRQVPVDGQTYPSFFPSEHRATSASGGALVIYQFFENASFHPFLGAGAGVIWTRDRIYTPRQLQTITRPPPSPPVVVVITEEQRYSRRDYDARGLLLVGFKAYPSERWFFRTDVQWTPATGDNREISWRLGLGIDF